jgi:uncharacterized protein YecE (DUF72 family)
MASAVWTSPDSAAWFPRSRRRPVAYVRFHGRNAAKWWQHEEAWERYDYTYSDDELAEWLPRLRQLDDEAPLTLVYMNNHWQGQAVGTARQMRMLLEGAGAE